MNYETFQPQHDLASLVKCHWILEVPATDHPEKQRIVPDGCIEMAFILGDDIKRYTSETDFIIQPRAIVIGQITEPFFIQPAGYVNTFAVRFYPYGFANFVTTPIKNFANKETPISELFGDKVAADLAQKITRAANTEERIQIAESFLLGILHHESTIDNIVKATIETLIATNGTSSIKDIIKEDPSRRRQLERNFMKQIGMSPKQLGKVIRLQAALKMLLNQHGESFTEIAYESQYYDQTHFIKDFKEFTGTTPKDFLGDNKMLLSSIFYSKD